tara:strand:- start:593 stop:829 length:237 start_codon:yes stop_codon:yes gene_type:complete
MLNLNSYFSLYLFDNRRNANMKTILKWITNRSIEPSSWAAAGTVIVGVSVLIDSFWWISVIGIAVAGMAILIRERGLI